jgi:hypothetical protein
MRDNTRQENYRTGDGKDSRWQGTRSERRNSEVGETKQIMAYLRFVVKARAMTTKFARPKTNQTGWRGKSGEIGNDVKARSQVPVPDLERAGSKG